ncbi:type II toxin-antitoxin system VapB15 family antitoxin [Algoriphagus marincola]|uniref:type II toxin-antitoxin system VapB15 family antitoxin n=1 Tax=Algoriphagus marincola TaxID=264027 RepID=UPI000423EB3A|nr:hypothetical protein [Algoriphagus marincola]
MKTAATLNLTFEQILSLVNQLPNQEKLKLARELEKELIDKKLSRLLQTFNTDEIDPQTLTEEVETVRQEIYERKKL